MRIVVTERSSCTASYTYWKWVVYMAVQNSLPHSCLAASSMFNRMTGAMVPSCTVMSYMLRPAALAWSRSTFATTFCWKLNVLLKMSCDWLWISKVAGQPAPLAVSLINLQSW